MRRVIPDAAPHPTLSILVHSYLLISVYLQVCYRLTLFFVSDDIVVIRQEVGETLHAESLKVVLDLVEKEVVFEKGGKRDNFVHPDLLPHLGVDWCMCMPVCGGACVCAKRAWVGAASGRGIN